MPLYIPARQVIPKQLDEILAAGYRRSGWYFYRTNCPSCNACEPMRLRVADFEPSRSQRRAQNKAAAALRFEVGPPCLDSVRVELFNRHRLQRGLSNAGESASAGDYQSFLLNAMCDVVELSIWLDEKLLAVSITDVGHESISAVYCFFDPDYDHYSLGTNAILEQVKLARLTERKWLYLGLYVAANSHLNYKANFLPHERLQNDVWTRFTRNPEKKSSSAKLKNRGGVPEKEGHDKVEGGKTENVKADRIKVDRRDVRAEQ